jgi:hypothetical protein
MARYFFHVMSEHTTYKDEVGRRFCDFEIAKAHAIVIAVELALDFEDYGGFWSA